MDWLRTPELGARASEIPLVAGYGTRDTMGMDQAPPGPAQELPVAGMIPRVEVDGQLERPSDDPRQIQVREIRGALPHAQHAISLPELFPGPLRASTPGSGAAAHIGRNTNWTKGCHFTPRSGTSWSASVSFVPLVRNVW
jgi:hypothetical protein